jgi:hypothetical protein
MAASISKAPPKDIGVEGIPFALFGNARAEPTCSADQPLTGEYLDRLAQGVASDAELRGKLRFQRKLAARRPFSPNDGFSDRMDRICNDASW